MGPEEEDEEIGIYRMTITKTEDTGRGSTRSQSVENSLWKRLWICLKRE
jgi:hypothetical protein